jgi:hypothetical protein
MGIGKEEEETHWAWMLGRASPSPPHMRAVRAATARGSSDLTAGWMSSDLTGARASSGHGTERTSGGPTARGASSWGRSCCRRKSSNPTGGGGLGCRTEEALGGACPGCGGGGMGQPCCRSPAGKPTLLCGRAEESRDVAWKKLAAEGIR